MPPSNFNDNALARFQRLIEANFTGRDELYAAAQALDDEVRRQVCQRLAEHLAGHAAELQQILTACGVEPAGPLDSESIAQALFRLAKLNRGETGVLDTAAEGERILKENYDRAIGATSGQQAENVLRRQRDDVAFGEQVLRGMAGSDQQPPLAPCRLELPLEEE